MRILNVTQSYDPFFEFGGPPVKVKALSEGLVKLGHEVTVLTADWGVDQRFAGRSDSPKPGPFGRRREANGVNAIYLPNWLKYRATSWNPALPRYLSARLRDFQVVHIFGLYDLLGIRVAAACRALHIPYIVEPIGMFVPMVRSIFLKRVYHAFFGKSLLNGATRLIATSEQEVLELQAGGIPASKIVLRENGVEVPNPLPTRGGFRRKIGIPPQAKLVLFLGRLSKKKSPDLLLTAFRDVCSRRTDLAGHLYLVFVGPDEAGMRAQLHTMASEFGLSSKVSLLGAVDGQAKWECFVDSEIFVLPSQNENFGNTAAEAVAAGTPVIVTDRCGIAPQLKGLAGLVVPHDGLALATALESLLVDEELYGQMKAGCEIALGSLGWEGPLAVMDSLYRSVAVSPDS